MKKYESFFLFENFQFLEVKFSIYLNRHVFVMIFEGHFFTVGRVSHYRSRGRKFKSKLGHIIFVENDQETFYTVILPLSLILTDRLDNNSTVLTGP